MTELNIEKGTRVQNPPVAASLQGEEIMGLAARSLRSQMKDHLQILPESHTQYTDKYFLRTGEILKAEELNPWVPAQVFIRKGPGVVAGMDEAVAVLDKYSDFREKGGRVAVLPDGSDYNSGETLMVINHNVLIFRFLS